MEMLIAMMAGAVGGAALRGRSVPLVLATALGILGGAWAWYLLALLGPGLKAGPLIGVHLGAGAAIGAALSAALGLAWRRASG